MYEIISNLDIENIHTPEEGVGKPVRHYAKTGKYKKKAKTMAENMKQPENVAVKATKKPTTPRVKLQEVVLDFTPEGEYLYALDFKLRYSTSRKLVREIEKKDWRRVSRMVVPTFRRALNHLLGEHEKMTFQFGVQYVGANNKAGYTLSHEGLEYSRNLKQNSFSTMWEDVEQGVFSKLSSRDRIISFRLLFQEDTVPQFCKEQKNCLISCGIDFHDEQIDY